MTVHLVGAGPGSVDLLTLRAAELLGRADFVVHDALVGEDIFGLVRNGAELISVAKRPGLAFPQEAINTLLVTLGSDPDAVVVRLKGGDPFVFGRGGEEALALAAAGIAYEVIPGVSSAFAAPAAAGIPVTHRGVAVGVTVVTGHRRDGECPVRWDALAGTGTTLVVLMGMAERHSIATGLQDGGMDGETPVAIIELASRPQQRVVRGRLSELHLLDANAPATVVIGPVAAFALDGANRSDEFAFNLTAGEGTGKLA